MSAPCQEGPSGQMGALGEMGPQAKREPQARKDLGTNGTLCSQGPLGEAGPPSPSVDPQTEIDPGLAQALACREPQSEQDPQARWDFGSSHSSIPLLCSGLACCTERGWENRALAAAGACAGREGPGAPHISGGFPAARSTGAARHPGDGHA